MGVVTFTSFVNIKKPSYIFFNNENLDRSVYISACWPKSILAFLDPNTLELCGKEPGLLSISW